MYSEVYTLICGVKTALPEGGVEAHRSAEEPEVKAKSPSDPSIFYAKNLGHSHANHARAHARRAARTRF